MKGKIWKSNTIKSRCLLLAPSVDLTNGGHRQLGGLPEQATVTPVASRIERLIAFLAVTVYSYGLCRQLGFLWNRKYGNSRQLSYRFLKILMLLVKTSNRWLLGCRPSCIGHKSIMQVPLSHCKWSRGTLIVLEKLHFTTATVAATGIAWDDLFPIRDKITY